jgi:Protein of unknown function (DUF3040)
VPLSEHEQRILRQIERQLQQERGLARALRMPADAREARRNARRASVIFLLGLVLLSVSFATYWLVGLVGFLTMLGSAVTLVQSVRRLARERWGSSAATQDSGAGTEPMSGGGNLGRPGRPAGGKWWTGRGGHSAGADDEGLGEP